MSQPNLEFTEPTLHGVPGRDALVRPVAPLLIRGRAPLALVSVSPQAAPRGRCGLAFKQLLAEATVQPGASLCESAWRE